MFNALDNGDVVPFNKLCGLLTGPTWGKKRCYYKDRHEPVQSGTDQQISLKRTVQMLYLDSDLNATVNNDLNTEK